MMNLSEGKQFLNELIEEHEKSNAMINQQFNFVKGLSFGLTYGIVGNFLVQFSYSLIDHGVMGDFGLLFYIDIFALVVSSAIIIIASLKLKKQIDNFRAFRKEANKLDKEIDKYKEMITATEKLVNAKRPSKP